jgi:hypothetical protein
MKAALLVALLAFALLGVSLHSRHPAANPLPLATPAHEHFTAVVDERLAAGSYTYVRVHDATGEARWVATLSATDCGAREVTVEVFARLARFESPRLARTFAPLSFGRLSPTPGVHP